MALVEVTLVTDDFNGAEGAEAFIFTNPLDGKDYSLDLTPENREQVQAVLDKTAEAMAEVTAFLSVAKRVTAKRGRKPKAEDAPKAEKALSEAGLIRTWARENGVEVGARGRIAPEVREAYEAAQAAPVPAPEAGTPAAIRAWAVENGIEVAERGRITDTVREAYAEAHAS